MGEEPARWKFSRSFAKKMTQKIYGPEGRVWVRDTPEGRRWSVGLERGSWKQVLATGASFRDCIDQLAEARPAPSSSKQPLSEPIVEAAPSQEEGSPVTHE